MRVLRISALALVLACPVLAAGAPAAVADVTAPGVLGGPVASFAFSVTPASAAPGDTVTLRATGCAARSTAAAPPLFASAALGQDGGPGQSTRVTVPADARPGASYEVTFTCGSEQGSTPLAVVPRTPPASPSAHGAVHTGLGERLSGPDTVEIVLGAVLVGVAGVLVYRRARSPRH